MAINPQNWSHVSLCAAGYLGSFQIDFRTDRVRGNYQVGPTFLILRKKMADGVPLIALESALHPFDLENLKRICASFAGHSGLYRTQLRVRNFLTKGYNQIEASFDVQVDRFGVPMTAKGALFDVSDLTPTRMAASAKVSPLRVVQPA